MSTNLIANMIYIGEERIKKTKTSKALPMRRIMTMSNVVNNIALPMMSDGS